MKITINTEKIIGHIFVATLFLMTILSLGLMVDLIIADIAGEITTYSQYEPSMPFVLYIGSILFMLFCKIISIPSNEAERIRCKRTKSQEDRHGKPRAAISDKLKYITIKPKV